MGWFPSCRVTPLLSPSPPRYSPVPAFFPIPPFLSIHPIPSSPIPPRHKQTNPTLTNQPNPDVLLAKPPWSHTHPLLSHTIFVSVPLPLARTRLVARHLASGLASTPAEADRRAVENDLPNGDEIIELRMEAVDDVVESFEDGGWLN